MGLLSCPDCGRDVSTRATACPHCGCPVSEMDAASTRPQASVPAQLSASNQRTPGPSAWWPTSGFASLVMFGFLSFAYVGGMWADMQPDLREYEAAEANRRKPRFLSDGTRDFASEIISPGELSRSPSLTRGSSRYLAGAICAAVWWGLIALGRGAMFLLTGVRGSARAPSGQAAPWVLLVVMTMSTVFGDTVVREITGWF